MSVTPAGLRAMEEAAQPLFLQHMPRDVAVELDRRYGLVLEDGGTGHVSVHMNDREDVSYEHRAVGKKRKAAR